ncbi:hypothetical protein BD311DRAFT_158030 [Dichomitus squalens]|uniref:Uncharacterized protein n=1 Tax=Dichomitus squalens TaxID=114155 RepID=A0A4Q9M5E7_9APHY|nr:hypothetical protein BD311DRAFT_158030 [Dichomitus squalens]
MYRYAEITIVLPEGITGKRDQPPQSARLTNYLCRPSSPLELLSSKGDSIWVLDHSPSSSTCDGVNNCPGLQKFGIICKAELRSLPSGTSPADERRHSIETSTAHGYGERTSSERGHSAVTPRRACGDRTSWFDTVTILQEAINAVEAQRGTLPWARAALRYAAKVAPRDSSVLTSNTILALVQDIGICEGKGPRSDVTFTTTQLKDDLLRESAFLHLGKPFLKHLKFTFTDFHRSWAAGPSSTAPSQPVETEKGAEDDGSSYVWVDIGCDPSLEYTPQSLGAPRAPSRRRRRS